MAMMLFGLAMFAGIPAGYYQGADCKSANDLKNALRSIISNHKNLGYSNLWDYYPEVYYVTGNKNQVLDLYSNVVNYFPSPSGMNKEHTVPKSWWGGNTGSGPGCDIINVIPSESNANSRKSNYPLGRIKGNPTWTNGVTSVGPSDVEGYTSTVFEPKDEYKGDFARIYFYVATCYPDLSWDSNGAYAMENSDATLKSWIIPLLLEWNAMDPVDADEITRNENIYGCQENRNPFIDYPSLCEYIWGSKKGEEFVFADHNANQGEGTETKTLAPTFNIDYGTEENPKNVINGTEVVVKGGTSQSVLYTRVNGGEWKETTFTTAWNSATETEYHVTATEKLIIEGDVLIEAYCTREGYLESDVVKAYYRGVNFDDDFLLHEEFDEVTVGNNTSNTGSSTAWEGNVNFPTVSSVFKAGNAIKLGSSKNVGSITSRELQTAGGSITVELDVKGWTNIEGKLEVSVSGAESQIVEYEAVMADDFEHVSLVFENVSANPVLTIATTTKRAFVDNISVTQNIPSAVEAVRTETETTAVYNINGQRVGNDFRGIVIVNGHKYFRK